MPIHSCQRHLLVLVSLLLVCGVAACRPGIALDPGVSVDTAPTGLRLRLRSSPTAMATAGGVETDLAWSLDHAFTEAAALTDIASVAGGQLIATTADDDVLLVFDSLGNRFDTLGQAGPGPGELRAPYVVLANDAFVVAVQADLLRTVTLFSRDGRYLRTISTPDGGDWVAMKYRGPSLSVNGPGKRPSGMEDPTRRFALRGNTLLGIIRTSEVNSRGAPTGVLDQGAWVLAFDLNGGGVDTLAVLSVPPVHALPPMAKDVYPLFDVPMYGALPLVAAGADWAAWAFGADSFVTVVRTSDTLRIEWPRSSRPLDEEDRIAAILNSGAQTLRFASDEMVAEVRKLGRSELRDMARQYAALWTFADSTPEVTALYAAGDCLLIAGFARDDYLDGTARTLLAVNVATPERTALFTIPVASGRIREADTRHVYVTSWSEAGSPILSAYALPDLGCASVSMGTR